MSSHKDRTPEELYLLACEALDNNEPKRATSYATTGLLSMAIGAAKSIAAQKDTDTVVHRPFRTVADDG